MMQLGPDSNPKLHLSDITSTHYQLRYAAGYFDTKMISEIMRKINGRNDLTKGQILPVIFFYKNRNNSEQTQGYVIVWFVKSCSLSIFVHNFKYDDNNQTSFHVALTYIFIFVWAGVLNNATTCSKYCKMTSTIIRESKQG